MKKIPQLSEPGAHRSDAGLPDDALSAEDATARAAVQAAQPAVTLAEALAQAESSASSSATKSGSGSKRKPGTNRRQARRYARERAVQALYQWDVAAESASQVRADFLEHQDMSRVDLEYFDAVFRGVSHDPDSVDRVLEPALDRTLEELDPVERAILRLSVWELQHRPDTPARVVISEGVEIAKRFGADQGHKFVNAVLDRLGAELRAAEMGRA